MKPRWMIIWTVLLFSHAPVWADAPKVDLIPELKDIEKSLPNKKQRFVRNLKRYKKRSKKRTGRKSR